MCDCPPRRRLQALCAARNPRIPPAAAASRLLWHVNQSGSDTMMRQQHTGAKGDTTPGMQASNGCRCWLLAARQEHAAHLEAGGRGRPLPAVLQHQFGPLHRHLHFITQTLRLLKLRDTSPHARATRRHDAPAAGRGRKYDETGASPVCWMVHGIQCTLQGVDLSRATTLSPSRAMLAELQVFGEPM